MKKKINKKRNVKKRNDIVDSLKEENIPPMTGAEEPESVNESKKEEPDENTYLEDDDSDEDGDNNDQDNDNEESTGELED